MMPCAAASVLARFAACLERGDAEGAAVLFTPDTAYDEPASGAGEA
jgi:hypothetical protein